MRGGLQAVVTRREHRDITGGSMERRGREEERQPPTSASRLLAQTPSSMPPPVSGAPGAPGAPSSPPASDEYPVAISVEVPAGALAATVAEWMPVEGEREGR